eukprot:jgi/Botrbrau1/7251/Bobra.0021s0033.2
MYTGTLEGGAAKRLRHGKSCGGIGFPTPYSSDSCRSGVSSESGQFCSLLSHAGVLSCNPDPGCWLDTPPLGVLRNSLSSSGIPRPASHQSSGIPCPASQQSSPAHPGNKPGAIPYSAHLPYASHFLESQKAMCKAPDDPYGPAPLGPATDRDEAGPCTLRHDSSSFSSAFSPQLDVFAVPETPAQAQESWCKAWDSAHVQPNHACTSKLERVALGRTGRQVQAWPAREHSWTPPQSNGVLPTTCPPYMKQEQHPTLDYSHGLRQQAHAECQWAGEGGRAPTGLLKAPLVGWSPVKVKQEWQSWGMPQTPAATPFQANQVSNACQTWRLDSKWSGSTASSAESADSTYRVPVIKAEVLDESGPAFHPLWQEAGALPCRPERQAQQPWQRPASFTAAGETAGAEGLGMPDCSGGAPGGVLAGGAKLHLVVQAVQAGLIPPLLGRAGLPCGTLDGLLGCTIEIPVRKWPPPAALQLPMWDDVSFCPAPGGGARQSIDMGSPAVGRRSLHLLLHWASCMDGPASHKDVIPLSVHLWKRVCQVRPPSLPATGQ